MSSIFDAPENYSWDNIAPISSNRLLKLKKNLESENVEIIDFRPLPQQADKSLPPIDEDLITGIERQIEARARPKEVRNVGEEHLRIVEKSRRPKP